ncbi:MAG: FMN-binding protein [Pseudolysinimonas sp.]
MPRQHARTTTRATALTFAGLGLMGALAACAPGSATGGDTGGSGGGDSANTDAAYADGTYTADGSYQAPSGTESITVELTLAGDKITDITVTPHATDPTAKGHQAEFVGGIADQTVGKDIDTLNVTRVSGSSLTSGGFKIAIAAIKEQAMES